MSSFVGTWAHVHSENMDEYLEAIGKNCTLICCFKVNTQN